MPAIHRKETLGRSCKFKTKTSGPARETGRDFSRTSQAERSIAYYS
jgi:hypothetical protein